MKEGAGRRRAIETTKQLGNASKVTRGRNKGTIDHAPSHEQLDGMFLSHTFPPTARRPPKKKQNPNSEKKTQHTLKNHNVCVPSTLTRNNLLPSPLTWNSSPGARCSTDTPSSGPPIMSPPTGIILQPGGNVTCPSLRMHHVLTKRVLGGRGLPSEMETSVTNLGVRKPGERQRVKEERGREHTKIPYGFCQRTVASIRHTGRC